MSKDNKKDKAKKPTVTQFDKFLDDQLLREKQKIERMKEVAGHGKQTPQQKYNKLYRERPQNRIVWRKK